MLNEYQVEIVLAGDKPLPIKRGKNELLVRMMLSKKAYVWWPKLFSILYRQLQALQIQRKSITELKLLKQVLLWTSKTDFMRN